MSEPTRTQTRSTTLARIATSLYEPSSIMNEIAREAQPRRPEGPAQPPQPELTPTEAIVAEIWAEVLHINEVKATDDFFALGGHSLSATQVIARLRERFNVEIPLAIIFDNGFTVAELASQIERFQIADAEPAEIEELLGNVAQLSDQEVEELIRRYSMDRSATPQTQK